MKKINSKYFLFFVCILSAFFSACVTVRSDITINSGQMAQSERKLADVEAAIIPLEAIGPREARNRMGDITAARQLINSITKEASADAHLSGQLTAWSGRLAILEGRYSEAVRLYRQSNNVSQGNFPSIILSIRLEGDPAKRMEMIEKELAFLGQRGQGSGELNIEKGRTLFEMNRFSEAAGAYDIAFSSQLNKIYSESYGAERNRAWELRNTSGLSSGSLDILGRETMTWNDCITLVRRETQLFTFLTGGAAVSDADLFNRLVDRGFIPIIQDITLTQWPAAKPRQTDNVTRAGAAWFILHLHAEARADRGMLSRYSTRYATGSNPRSPIADVPPLSPFFDSILGCVEREYMSLPDGRNFRPTQPMRSTDFLSIIRKIDN